MDLVELFGLLAAVIVASSFLMKDVIKLRLVNMTGAICFVIYGLIIGSISVTALNIFVTCVNGYYIFKSKK